MHLDLEPVNPLALSILMVIDIDPHSRSRKDGGFVWTIYANTLLVRCSPVMHTPSLPYPTGRFKEDRIGIPDLIFLYDV